MSISNGELTSYVIERRIWSLSFFKAKMVVLMLPVILSGGRALSTWS